jgi:hypothetical protein
MKMIIRRRLYWRFCGTTGTDLHYISSLWLWLICGVEDEQIVLEIQWFYCSSRWPTAATIEPLNLQYNLRCKTWSARETCVFLRDLFILQCIFICSFGTKKIFVIIIETVVAFKNVYLFYNHMIIYWGRFRSSCCQNILPKRSYVTHKDPPRGYFSIITRNHFRTHYFLV